LWPTTVQNFLFVNRGNGKFEEIGLMAEVAYSEDGRPRSGMGVDSANFNGDSWSDLFVANVDQEKFSIYQNNKDETFRDQAMTTGVGQATLLLSRWGLKFFDFDNDGAMDFFLANGLPTTWLRSTSKSESSNSTASELLTEAA